MGAYSRWEEDYEREQAYREELENLTREEKIDRWLKGDDDAWPEDEEDED